MSPALLDRPLFQAWMADRLQLAVPGLARDRAARWALSILADRLAVTGAVFGHPDHLWDEPAAWALVDLDLADNPLTAEEAA